MIKKIFKHTYFLIVLFSTIGGAFAFYQQITNGNDYSLSLYLKNSEKIIENNNRAPGLSMLFNGNEIKSLYLSKIQLKNTGKRALTKDFIYEPITITTGVSNKILQINQPSQNISYKDNILTINWVLLNPKENIETSIFTIEPVNIKVNQKLKEISKINFINEVANPPTDKRIKSLGLLWLFLILFSIAITVDAILLVKADIKLGRIFNLVNSLPKSGSIDKKTFFANLSALYEDYYQAIPWAFVKPEELINILSEKFSLSESISDRELEILDHEVIKHVRYANLYSIRSMNIFGGPLLFGFCFIRVLVALLF